MRLTDLAIANKEIRRWRKAQTLEGTVSRRLDWHLKHSSKEIGAGHINRARDIIAACKRAQWDCPGCRLDGRQNVGWEINTYLSSRAILDLPVNEVLDWVFKGLPRPGPAQHTDYEQTLVTMMNNMGRDKRARQHQFLLMTEMAYRTKQDWYVIFNTLTVRSGTYHLVFNKTSKEFKNYVRNFERRIYETAYGTRNPAKELRHQTDHVYFACVEEGGTTGRLHIHIVHLCRRLPSRVRDPNAGRSHPTRRELDSLKGLWKHGYSTPIAARFSPRDAYGLDGWRWPIDSRTQDALVIKSPLALANYMSKYINKGYTSCKRAELLWRVRKTQSLGLAPIRELLSTLTVDQLLLTASDDTLRLKLNNQTIPNQILRQQSLKLLDLQSTTKCSNSVTLMEIARETTPRLSLLASSRASTQTIPASNLPNITSILTERICDTDDYNEKRAAIYQAARNIDNKYFGRTLLRGGKTSTADWIHPTNVRHEQITNTKHTNRRVRKAHG